MNFLGVLIGGITVAYALVELLPAEVLSPPSGAPAVGMLVALFVAALFWNIGTWWFGLPNSSSASLVVEGLRVGAPPAAGEEPFGVSHDGTRNVDAARALDTFQPG